MISAAPDPDGAGKKILVVDDDPVTREFLRQVLEVHGFKPVAAPNPRVALELMANEVPNLILSDVSMPEMDGFEFYREVRRRSEWVPIPFVFLTGRGEQEDVLAGKDLGAEDYLVKPVVTEELLTTIRSRLARTRQLEVAQLERSYEASITVLANAIEIRDLYTRGHVERVTAYAQTIADFLGWDSSRRLDLRFGSILHDIGKIFVADAILKKVEPLSEDEWDALKQHPVSGAEMIHDVPFLATAVPIVRHHHERWDGRGYPEGLEGRSIPPGARVVSVADSFDAMTTTRVYRKVTSLEDALEEIENCAGSQYDPEVVAAFRRAWDTGAIREIAEG